MGNGVQPESGAVGTRRHPPTRRGGIYVLVLMVSVFVAVVGVSALTLARIGMRQAQDAGKMAKAELNARAAIEVGFNMISTNANWRTSPGVGVWIAERTWGGEGTIYLEATGLTGTRGVDDRVTLRGIGKCGEATQILEVSVDLGSVVVDSSWVRVVY